MRKLKTPSNVLACGKRWRDANRAYERHRSRCNKARAKGWAFPPPENECPPRPDDHRCEIPSCRREVAYDLTLDHDHTTGRFRGWICQPCNGALGRWGDDLAGFEAVVAYLKGDWPIL